MQSAFVALFILMAAWVAVSDLLTRRIPNWAVVAIVSLWAITVLFGTREDADFNAVMVSIGIAGLGFLAGFLLFRLRMMGAGDGKLLAACLLWCGPKGALDFLVISGLAGGVLSLLLVLPPVRTLLVAGDHYAKRGFGGNGPVLRLSDGVPYGVALAFAAVFIVGGQQFQWF